jgi:hypothetical protein
VNVRGKLTIAIKKPVIKSLPPHTFTCPTCDGSAKLTIKKLISRIAPNALDTSPQPNRTRLLFESVTGLAWWQNQAETINAVRMMLIAQRYSIELIIDGLTSMLPRNGDFGNFAFWSRPQGRPWKWQSMESMESHKAGFPLFPHSLEIPSGFPHSHGLDGGLGV